MNLSINLSGRGHAEIANVSAVTFPHAHSPRGNFDIVVPSL
jgi:hypothetical protein